MQSAFAQDVQQVAAFYGVDVKQGLSAAQVDENRQRYGRNALDPEKYAPLWKLVLKQFDDLLVKILLAAAVVDFIIALSDGEGIWGALVEPMVIFLILIANATVGVITERNAEQAIEELKAYEAESATVIRGGQLQSVPAADVVPGDVVELTVGAKVPADIRLALILGSVLKVDQSLLTGESESVEKSPAPVTVDKPVYQDMTCVLFSGTLIVAGRARGIAIATGSNTAIGKIRDALREGGDDSTPLKQKLDEFGELLSKVIAAICVLVWMINIRRFNDPALGGWVSGALHYLKIAVALAVAAIPEGLPAVVTTCLALGTRKMAKRNAIVRTLPSVETLGCTTVICSDKTGTLTTNQMTVSKAALISTSSTKGVEALHYDISGTTYSSEGSILGPNGMLLKQPAEASPALLHMAACAALCNDSNVVAGPQPGTFQRIGEPTELALRAFCEKVGLPPSESPLPALLTCNAHWLATHPRTSVLEFTRDRKMMSVLVSCPPGSCLFSGLPAPAAEGGRFHQRSAGPAPPGLPHLLLCKGAPESVLSRCSTAMSPTPGEGPVPMTPAIAAAVDAAMAELGGRQALRCLALAARLLPSSHTELRPEDEANGLTLLGIVGLHDPPRPECRAALETCRAAGIRVVMVTGDNKATAEAVARQLGLLAPGGGAASGDAGAQSGGMPLTRHMDEVDHVERGCFDGGVAYTGAEFECLRPDDQVRASDTMLVLSRVEPLHKLKLVELLRSQGHVVAMTGDGVNDAPALMRADIGVAMGSGTAVARNAADMVLADDNFATVVLAVAEGRAIYNNTKQFIRYMISSNIGEVASIFLTAALGLPENLIPLHDQLQHRGGGGHHDGGDAGDTRGADPCPAAVGEPGDDGLPATALGFNRADREIMKQPPRRMNEPIVNGWLFTRYLVIGMYVGVSTVMGFLWWFMWYDKGGNLSWSDLTQYQHCSASGRSAAPAAVCEALRSAHPRTVAMTVLVVIEMFNALNNLSEDASLLQTPPWDNRWLLGAIGTSMALHCFILYVPSAARLFGVTGLSGAEWIAVLWLSAPVILIDEVMKAVSGVESGRGWQADGPGLGLEESWGVAPYTPGMQLMKLW
eukprot:CAMPEP_0202921722 /NCGR_PEP_ID=MMETSP1392-20130828/77545_1 /ASSEMBLY_ACC=CAM_ASM_000868 /TAXON_ID=225041 /ORGANISM="Chlamydomonas chlamydogama, Strain SAG 11-48b" /LENGTH=1097 /DNA_ID=CAMNT_0049615311 /DNA_START=39 /DNA_END=3331 /DNA_ORIENTATION=+